VKENKHLKDALRLVRIYGNLTLKQLSEKSNFSVSYLSELENGRRSISLKIVSVYASIFGLKQSDILSFAEDLEKDFSSQREILLKFSNYLKEN
jgi:transcriptional regulator with XRE-family HTH domain